jgi:hypothetical protein
MAGSRSMTREKRMIVLWCYGGRMIGEMNRGVCRSPMRLWLCRVSGPVMFWSAGAMLKPPDCPVVKDRRPPADQGSERVSLARQFLKCTGTKC